MVFLLSLAHSSLIMLMMTRKGIRQTLSAPTSGWGLGLGIGSMLAARLGYRALEWYDGFSFDGIIQLLALCTLLPLSEAVMTCGQAARTQRKERWLALFWSTVVRGLAWIFLVTAIISVWWWIFLLPPLLLGYSRAQNVWLPEALTPEAKRRLRRVMAQAKKRESAIERRKQRWSKEITLESE